MDPLRVSVILITITILSLITETLTQSNTKAGNGPRVFSGENATSHEFPFMAALVRNKTLFCGGSLVGRKHVLTAAHCVVWMSKDHLWSFQVVLGAHKRNIEEDNGTGEGNRKRGGEV